MVALLACAAAAPAPGELGSVERHRAERLAAGREAAARAEAAAAVQARLGQARAAAAAQLRTTEEAAADASGRMAALADRRAEAEARLRARAADLAPTLLDLMGLPRPAEMTGRSLLRG